VHPAPLPLIKDGKIMRRNLRQELLTVDDLLGQLREQGVHDVSEVKRSFIESDGHLSVIKFQPDEQQQQPKRRSGLGG
jgi:uncharacterized membrane protein YcaP (DUF421 family)